MSRTNLELSISAMTTKLEGIQRMLSPIFLVKFSFIKFVLILTIINTTTANAAGGINIDTSNGFAIHGYDPVAYFVSAKALEGNPALTYKFEGNKWMFVNQTNKLAFIANPEAYIPQYGGHCAYAASKNKIADSDPYAWTVHDNKLYLNYSIATRSTWLQERDTNILKANENWPELAKKLRTNK